MEARFIETTKRTSQPTMPLRTRIVTINIIDKIFTNIGRQHTVSHITVRVLYKKGMHGRRQSIINKLALSKPSHLQLKYSFVLFHRLIKIITNDTENNIAMKRRLVKSTQITQSQHFADGAVWDIETYAIEFGLIHLRPCQHDDCYIDGRSQIKVHTDERTQVHGTV